MNRLEDDAEIAGAIIVLGHDAWLRFARSHNSMEAALQAAKADMDIALKLHARMLMGDTAAHREERTKYLCGLAGLTKKRGVETG